MKNVYLKHVGYRDVCIFVPFLRVFNGTIKAKGTFWNQVGYDMAIGTKVEIRGTLREEWLYAFDSKGPWKPLPP